MEKSDESSGSSTGRKPADAGPSPVNTYPFYAPRFWHGMNVPQYIRLLLSQRFRIHPLRMPMAIIIAGFSVYNSAMSAIQSLFFAKKIRETELTEPPIFIIGHWRSGTTFLHELFFQDDRLTSPTTYECFAPNHFLVTGGIIPKFAFFLLPSRRPMDDMPVGFDLPQEDEFALCAMGAPTPMYRSAFPNEPPPFLETLNMQGVSAATLSCWQKAVRRFFQSITFARPQRLVLKSPPHTGRMGQLAEMFPGCRFVHIARDPVKIFQSTVRLWKTLDEAQGFQVPRHEGLEEFVLNAFELMYDGFEKARVNLESHQLCELCYEDLIADPMGSMETLYSELGLDEFESVRPKLESFIAGRNSYRPNRHVEVEPELLDKIRSRWADYIRRYGYQV